ncbi:MAG: putative cupin superfamily protein [Halieaceae bacterium]|jgi:uncharacterized cupin superfamily protein
MTVKTIIRLSANPDGFGQTTDELSQELFTSALPTQHSHEYYADDGLGLYIGVWDTDDMIETSGPYACDEFMWLIEGEAQIKNSKTGSVETASAGEPFIIPRGYDCQWHQRGYLRKFYVIWENPVEPIPETPSVEAIIIPRSDAPCAVMKTIAPFKVTSGGAPRENICYTDITGRFVSGTWQSDAFDSEARPFPYAEFAYVQAGSIQLRDEAGIGHVFNAGEAFFVPEETICSARVEDAVTLFFAIVMSRT